jgi:hypothetical protein
MKVMIRGKTISYSSYKNKEKNKSESDLGKQLSELYANNGNETEIQETYLPSSSSELTLYCETIRYTYITVNNKCFQIRTNLKTI